MPLETLTLPTPETDVTPPSLAESVVSRLGADLAASGRQSKVDIYGAPAGIQLRKSDRGVKYSTAPAFRGGPRTPQHAIRVRVEQGRSSQQEVDEIILHEAVTMTKVT